MDYKHAMPKLPKSKSKTEDAVKKHFSKDLEEESLISQDVNDRGYYYDDAYGYEVYKPETDEDLRGEKAGKTE